jgi:hypothetical protein
MGALTMILAAVVDNSVTRTLGRALKAMGSLQRLAEHLGVSEAEVARWLAGSGSPPTPVYLRALDLVARGPFARK